MFSIACACNYVVCVSEGTRTENVVLDGDEIASAFLVEHLGHSRPRIRQFYKKMFQSGAPEPELVFPQPARMGCQRVCQDV